MAAWERQAWQSVSVQVGEGTHHPQSLSASLPEAVLPAGMQLAVQLAVAAPKQHISISTLSLLFQFGEEKACIIIQKVCANNIIKKLKATQKTRRVKRPLLDETEPARLCRDMYGILSLAKSALSV